MEIIFDVGGKLQYVDLEKIAYARAPRYGLIRIDGRSCLQVSEVFEIETPESKAVSKIRKAYVVDINRNARVGDLHVCYEVLFDEDGEPCLLVDDGVCFLHDTKEFGHYILWNDATGELSVSEELDWQDVGLYSSKEFAEQICGQLNEILAQKPVQEAPMGADYQNLYNRLDVSNWRVIVDSFEKKGDQVFGHARVVSADSDDYRRVMGGTP